MRSPLDLKGCQVHPSPQSPKGLFRADPEAPTGIGCAPEPNTKFTISADSGEVFRIEQRATVSVGDESEPIGPLAIRALEATTAHFLERVRLIQGDLHKVTAERDAALDQCEDSSGYWQPRVDALDRLVVKRGEELTAVKEALRTSEARASLLLNDREVAAGAEVEENSLASPTVFDRVRTERDRLVVEVGNLRHELEQRAEQEAHETSSEAKETDRCDT